VSKAESTEPEGFFEEGSSGRASAANVTGRVATAGAAIDIVICTDAKTLPVMVASQTGSQGISRWSTAALSTAAIAPLVIVGIVLERYIIKGMTAGAVK
jgi:hypothetical protein